MLNLRISSQLKDLNARLGPIAVLLFGFLGLACSAPAQLSSRPQSLELSCVYVHPIEMKYLEKHVNFNAQEKNLETRVVDQFIKRLDGSKLYLSDADVKSIQKMMTNIFVKTKSKDCSPIIAAHDLFKKRVAERVAFAKKTLGPKFQFEPKTEVLLDSDLRKRAKSAADANKIHENFLQYQVATYLATDMKIEEAKQQVGRNYERVQKRIDDYKTTDLLSFYLDSFARALDPHSSYLSKDALEDFEIQMRLSLEGIGATLSSQDGFTVIEQLLPGGAASNSGQLKPKDKIIAVGQNEGGELQNVIEMDLRDVVRLIRGKKGSKVRLRILRKGEKDSDRFEVTLVRDQIKLEDDAASITYMDREVDGQKKKIGLINLPSFYADNRRNGPSAAGDVKKLLAEAKKNKTDAIVLDFSTNGGGSLRDAVDIAGLFIATGNVVKQSQKAPIGDKMSYEILDDTDKNVNWNGPLVVLTSRVSASASEIVAGTLQDYNRAIVVGADHTFGKGSVQSVEYLPPGLGAIKTTVGMFFTPGGNSTQHRGVPADIEIPSPYSMSDIGEKTLEYSLPPKKIKPFLSKSAYVVAGSDVWKTLTPEVSKKLKKTSDARVAGSEEFKKVSEELKKNSERGKKIVLSALIQDRKDKKGDKKEGDAGADASDPESPESDDYSLSREERKKKYLERADIKEAVNIAADLILELANPQLTLGSAKDPKGSSGAAEENSVKVNN